MSATYDEHHHKKMNKFGLLMLSFLPMLAYVAVRINRSNRIKRRLSLCLCSILRGTGTAGLDTYFSHNLPVLKVHLEIYFPR